MNAVSLSRRWHRSIHPVWVRDWHFRQVWHPGGRTSLAWPFWEFTRLAIATVTTPCIRCTACADLVEFAVSVSQLRSRHSARRVGIQCRGPARHVWSSIQRQRGFSARTRLRGRRGYRCTAFRSDSGVTLGGLSLSGGKAEDGAGVVVAGFDNLSVNASRLDATSCTGTRGAAGHKTDTQACRTFRKPRPETMGFLQSGTLLRG